MLYSISPPARSTSSPCVKKSKISLGRKAGRSLRCARCVRQIASSRNLNGPMVLIVVCHPSYSVLFLVTDFSRFFSRNFPASMNRKVLKDFTFSDGTILPAGTYLSVASFATHHDEAIYANPYEFDGFRFANLREGDGESTFEHERHSWCVDFFFFFGQKILLHN